MRRESKMGRSLPLPTQESAGVQTVGLSGSFCLSPLTRFKHSIPVFGIVLSKDLFVVCYESLKRELKTKSIYGY